MKRKGTRTFTVRICPRGPIRRRHIEQLQPRNVSEEDNEGGEDPQCFPTSRVPSTENTTYTMHGTDPASNLKSEIAAQKYDSYILRRSKRTF